MENDKSVSDRIIWAIIIPFAIAVLAGVIVAVIVGEGRFQVLPPFEIEKSPDAYRPLQICPFIDNGKLYLNVVSKGGSCIPSVPLVVDGEAYTAYLIRDREVMYDSREVPDYEQTGGWSCNYRIDMASPPQEAIVLTLVDLTDEEICHSPDRLTYSAGLWIPE